MSRPHHIQLISLGEARASVLHGLLELFETASSKAEVIGQTGLSVDYDSGMRTAKVLYCNPKPDAIVVLPSNATEQEDEQAILDGLVHAHKSGTLIGSICLGAFDLARSGLLDGRRATTHWNEADRFASQFPKVCLDSNQILIDDGDLVTAGGMTAWTDLGLNLVNRFLGPSIMLETARMLLTDPGGREQRFYAVFHANLKHKDPAILSVQHDIHAAPEKRWTVPEMASRARLGDRTFLRRFKSATGETPVRYVLLIRIARARERLETSVTPVSEIAWDLGYADVNAFRKVFWDLVGLTPSDYRRRFSPRSSG
ncbi:GlxA family transcriptional regulator [Roseibium sp.]|uniref:GlxA family transcriptional regulator n=1 Tax=Roseibium sp. TaxID=1936156 RepID=UPI003B5304A5